MAAAMLDAPPAPSTITKPLPKDSCPNCGTTLEVKHGAGETKSRIEELEAQIEMLKEKATAAGTF